jgi:hypothetical protein
MSAAGGSNVDLSAVLARARRVSVDLSALADHSMSLLNGPDTATTATKDDSSAPVASGSADSEVSIEDVLSRFKAVQLALHSIQEADELHASVDLNGTFVPTEMGLQAVADLQEICSDSLPSFVSAAAKVSMDLIPQASCIQEAVQQQLALFGALYKEGADLSDERVLAALEKMNAAIHASSADPLSVAPSLAPHVSMLSGAASGMNWIASSSTPREQITDTLNAVPVFGKRIMERGATDVELVKALQVVLRRLLQHVSRFHPNHVVWDFSSQAMDQAKELSAVKNADDALRHDANKIFQSNLNFAELYATFYEESVEPWLATGVHMEEMVQRQMKLCEMAFKEQQKLLGCAMVHRQPKNDEEWGQALGHLNMLLNAIEEMGNQRGEACVDKMRM